MSLHDNKLCRQKCDGVLENLSEILSVLEYPRSDREQQVKAMLEVVVEDIKYLKNETAGDDDFLTNYARTWR